MTDADLAEQLGRVERTTLERLLRANIRTAVVEAGGLRQQERPDYPMVALREAIVNAVVHRHYESSNAPTSVRWFDDRVEVLSPGGPFGSVTQENFAERNDYRNPVLAAALKHLGYVNRFGRGIALIQATLADNGNPPAEFQIDAAWWSVTMRGAR
ncbi:MAG: ATP-binding protein [Gaiellales bacterium]